MSLLRVYLSNESIATLEQDIREKFLDVINGFDYTVFKHYKLEDQTTIQGVNVTKIGNCLTFNKQIVIKYNIYQDDRFDMYRTESSIRDIEFTITADIIDGEFYKFNIQSNNRGEREKALTITIGDASILVNNTFHDKETFESDVFQKSTVDKVEPIGIQFVLEIINKLKA